MSEHEMQFADPQWQPPRQRQHALDQEPVIPQPVNGPPRERAYQSYQRTPLQDEEATADNAEYTNGYRAQQPGYQYTSRMSGRPRRKRSPWFWIILILILAAAMGGCPFEEATFLEVPGVVVSTVALSRDLGLIAVL